MTANIKESKLVYAERMNALLDKYSKVVFCQMDNVRSQQVHNVRRDLRGKAELLMGKKTLQKKVISIRGNADDASNNDKAMAQKLSTEELLSGNLGLLFTNEDPSVINDILLANKIKAPARVGSIAPTDVVVPAGNTGLEPTMTSFFQALNIPTKIAKGTVEITTERKVLATGDKVDNSTATLLAKLKIFPFFYAMDINSIWDNGVLFTKDDLSVTDEVLEEAFVSGINNITALSLGAGIPTEASFPHMVTDAFKTLLAASVETEFVFTEFNGEQLRADAKAGKLGGGAAAPAAAAGAAAPAKAAAAPVEESSDDDDGMGGLF